MTTSTDISTLRSRLVALLNVTADDFDGPHYGFALVRRDDAGTERFGIVSLAGEAVVLTGEMLAALDAEICWLDGTQPVRLDDGHDVFDHAPAGAPTPTVALTAVERDGNVVPLGAPWDRGALEPAALSEPVLLLVGARPHGWPA